ncbi:hypothetical protein D3C77_362720 [compost metagenome]
MPIIKKLLLTLLLVLAASPATSFALICRENGSGEVLLTQDLGTALAVAADVPDGTIIWESEPHSIKIRCADNLNKGPEKIYFFLNPGIVSVGKGIRVGIRYGSKAYSHNGGVYTGFTSAAGCKFSCVGWDKAIFDLNFTVFIEKYGVTPESGQATQLSNYRVFQLVGAGLTSADPVNFNFAISGLDKIRFVPCSPDLSVFPNVVNFSKIRPGKAQIGNVASSGNFSLRVQKKCDTPYTVNARFSTTAGGGTIVDNLLVPQNNKSVGISLFRQGTDERVPFATWFPLTELAGREQSVDDFRADLIWRTDPVPGSFDASLVIDMFYK